MKKSVSILIVLILLFTHCMCAFAEPTQKINLLQFLEVYHYRRGLLKEHYGIEVESGCFADVYTPAICVTSQGIFDTDENLNITRMTVDFFGVKDDGNIVTDISQRYSCILSFSALEYSTVEDSTIKMMYDGGLTEYMDVAGEAYDAFRAIAFSEELSKYPWTENGGNSGIIYSGNYDYSFRVIHNEDSDDSMLIIAQARES